ncbi:TetR family transcriptional regulator [Kocuria sabuli]|uniref:TetR family transcriptional regulator n=1 Tax=Kocuria sabuli TaxID=3071448 RepID=UPI0034D54826
MTFHPTDFRDDTVHDIEAEVLTMIERMDELVEEDPITAGAPERAYLRTHEEGYHDDTRDQRALLLDILARPELADELHLLHRSLDREALHPGPGPGLLGIIIRLAMDGLWLSDLTDPDRFEPTIRYLLVDALHDLSRVNLHDLHARTGITHGRPSV